MSAINKVLDGQKYLYTVPGFIKETGFIPHVVDGASLPLLLCEVEAMDPKTRPKLWADNPRLDVRVTGQKQLERALAETNTAATKALKEALDINGGQCEFLYIWKNVIVEGNRRGALMLGKQETLSVAVFPDDTTEEQILTVIAKKHLSGPLEWASAQRSQTAWTFHTQHGWSIEKICKHFMFKSQHEVRRYIRGYVWLVKGKELYPYRAGPDGTYRGIQDSDWSKFHHATVPRLIEKFEPTPGVFTEDFDWFCALINDEKLMNCRESDGVVAPLIKDNDVAGLKILNTEGAEAAWTYLKGHRKELSMVDKLKAVLVALEDVVKDNQKCKARQTNPGKAQYVEERSHAALVKIRIDELMEKTAP